MEGNELAKRAEDVGADVVAVAVDFVVELRVSELRTVHRRQQQLRQLDQYPYRRRRRLFFIPFRSDIDSFLLIINRC